MEKTARMLTAATQVDLKIFLQRNTNRTISGQLDAKNISDVRHDQFQHKVLIGNQFNRDSVNFNRHPCRSILTAPYYI
ncbi:MAG: hypothetical protein ABJL55_06040 [Roseibium sp.]